MSEKSLIFNGLSNNFRNPGPVNKHLQFDYEKLQTATIDAHFYEHNVLYCRTERI